MVIGVSNRGTPEAQLASTQPRRRRRAPLQQRVRHNLTGYTFLIGAILCFTYFSWYPMVKEAISSF
ncbi:MAG: multiple sugar transport system permease protein, partial [Frankiales bacterium]|nr:multiple sugar transport system permease protein [Frankiales bacterium]